MIIEFRGYTYTTKRGFHKAIHSGRWDDVELISYDALAYRLSAGYTPEECVIKKTRAINLPKQDKERERITERDFLPVQSYLNMKWTKENASHLRRHYAKRGGEDS